MKNPSGKGKRRTHSEKGKKFGNEEGERTSEIYDRNTLRMVADMSNGEVRATGHCESIIAIGKSSQIVDGLLPRLDKYVEQSYFFQENGQYSKYLLQFFKTIDNGAGKDSKLGFVRVGWGGIDSTPFSAVKVLLEFECMQRGAIFQRFWNVFIPWTAGDLNYTWNSSKSLYCSIKADYRRWKAQHSRALDIVRSRKINLMIAEPIVMESPAVVKEHFLLHIIATVFFHWDLNRTALNKTFIQSEQPGFRFIPKAWSFNVGTLL